MSFSRRDFLKLAALSSAAAPWGWMPALAATPATDDYRALVCIFLYGGNDGNNLLIPTDSAGYAAYAGARGSLALQASDLATLGAAASQGGKSFALHSGLSPIAPLYLQGKLAAVANVGTLVNPMTAADYRAKTKQRPFSLFSHSDQQHQWQSAESAVLSATGWGGRIADAVLSSNAQVTVPALMSIAGSSLFNNGKHTAPLVIPGSGTFGLKDNGTSAAAKARNSGLAQLLGLDQGNALVSASANVITQAIASSVLVNPIIQGTSATISPAFAGLSSSIATQLMMVAKLIEARATTGLKRQVFYVALNGFDTHSNQLNVQQTLFGQLGPAMLAFYNATVALGVADKVTSFTMSDFSRTLKPNSSGTDHAWGNHHLVLGGAVKGGDVYGAFPTLALNGADDADGAGRWVPTTSVDQYAATLASWLGVSTGDLATVLPNLSRFASSNIGFV
ncbi:MAG: DUF1501 domain-containing protein [Proteobacteria bacterium]|nr:DUF1501 domain-containing protein [Pseudomonadota bacterium]